MKRLPLLLIICALSVFGLAACGDDNSSSDTTTEPAATETTTTGESGGGGGGETVQVAADPDGALEFVQKSLRAPVGQATFEFTNQSSTPHDFVLERDGQELAKTDVITQGEDTSQAHARGGRVHLLLLGSRPPPSRNGRHAHGRVARLCDDRHAGTWTSWVTSRAREEEWKPCEHLCRRARASRAQSRRLRGGRARSRSSSGAGRSTGTSSRSAFSARRRS